MQQLKMCCYFRGLLFIIYSFHIVNGADVTNSKKSPQPTMGINAPKSLPISDLSEKQPNVFHTVSFPTNILDMKETYNFEPVSIDTYKSKPNFDRSVQQEQLAANLRKKLKNLNASTSVVDDIQKITRSKNYSPKTNDKSKENKPDYGNSRQWARRLAALSKGSRLCPTKCNALTSNVGGQNVHNNISACTSMWSKDIPILQVIDNAITVIEKMVNKSIIFNPNQDPSITAKEVKKIITVVQNIQDILKILDCLNGMDKTLYYNIKTGVSTKTPEPEEQVAPVDSSSTKSEEKGNNTVTVIQIVDQAINIVEDLLNCTVLNDIEKNKTNQNVVVLSVNEAEEIVDVVETIKDILGILEELNGNVDSSFDKMRSLGYSDTMKKAKIQQNNSSLGNKDRAMKRNMN